LSHKTSHKKLKSEVQTKQIKPSSALSKKQKSQIKKLQKENKDPYKQVKMKLNSVQRSSLNQLSF